MAYVPVFRVFEVLGYSISVFGVDWTTKATALATYPTPPSSVDYDNALSIMSDRVDYWERVGHTNEFANAVASGVAILTSPANDYADFLLTLAQAEAVANLGYSDCYHIESLDHFKYMQLPGLTVGSAEAGWYNAYPEDDPNAATNAINNLTPAWTLSSNLPSFLTSVAFELEYQNNSFGKPWYAALQGAPPVDLNGHFQAPARGLYLVTIKTAFDIGVNTPKPIFYNVKFDGVVWESFKTDRLDPDGQAIQWNFSMIVPLDGGEIFSVEYIPSTDGNILHSYMGIKKLNDIL